MRNSSCLTTLGLGHCFLFAFRCVLKHWLFLDHEPDNHQNRRTPLVFVGLQLAGCESWDFGMIGLHNCLSQVLINSFSLLPLPLPSTTFLLLENLVVDVYLLNDFLGIILKVCIFCFILPS
jgi:hypothetical protein